ncbi:MAG: DUF4375 domain-containing protein [Fluviicoccus sp.]|uniref:DMP19 family protein n=1 Tax=Fluviicoccus sp. TaxID=2003552 RepID=UPI00272288B2|nr:DUF4375 domain-containing protein [Fluviicoccus sp.]MDO8330511.1 DUF4375 domain-containing protein [Fluviicoccus sp.]
MAAARLTVALGGSEVAEHRGNTMTIADLLSEFSIKIYEPPLSDLRDNGGVRDLSDPIAVVMLILDFETEVSMNGITNFIGNSTGIYSIETVAALDLIGCSNQSQQLKTILEIATAAGMTHDTIQQDRSGLSEYEITSFAKLHGEIWDYASAQIDKLESAIDYTDIMDNAAKFVAKHQNEFCVALGR